jgi:hypothetical protein
MPSASEELRAEWGGADGIGEDKAASFLREKGWHCSDTFLWSRPNDREISEEEWRALDFLIHEWDFGYIP